MTPDFHIEPHTFEAPEIDPSSRIAAVSARGERSPPALTPRMVPVAPGTHATGAAGTTTDIIRLPR